MSILLPFLALLLGVSMAVSDQDEATRPVTTTPVSA